MFHSPGYRSRYAEFLKIDFPRLPLTGNLELFRALARLGGELVALHLMESPKLDAFITTYTGPKNPEVERVGWSDDTVWLDAAATKKGQPATAGTIGFRDVPEAVWNFHIGGYQVCEKWLKDRKGRTLSKDDIAHYQKIVVALNETIRLMQEIDVVIEQHGGWPGAFHLPAEASAQAGTGEAQAAAPKVIPFRPRIVQPGPKERYITCVPLVPLKAAAGAFSDPQHIEDDGFEWAAVETKRRLRPGMFVAQVVGKSMEPAISDGAYCLFAAPVEGTRQGKTVLVQLRDATDPESGERYTVKRYESEKAQAGDSWRHERITLKPVNHAFTPIVLTGADEGQLQVIAEFVEVLGESPEPRTDEAPAPDANDPEFRLTSPARQPTLLDLGRAPLVEPHVPEVQPEPRAAEIAVEELPCHVRQLFRDGEPRDRESAIQELRGALGFERTGRVIRETLDNALRTAVRRGILTNDGTRLALGVATIEHFDRAFLKDQFLASLEGRAWRAREDAVRAFARWLGFRRTGQVIEDTAQSIINGLIREQRLEARDGELRRVD